MTVLFDDAGKQALVQAIKNIEAQSSAEIVIAVRRSSDTYRAADLALGMLAATTALAFMLFSPFAFGTISLFVDPLIAGALAALLSAYAPFIKLFFLSKSRRREAVRCAATLAFMEQGVHRTRGRTGVLVFLSLLEGMAELVVDTGVEARLEEVERLTMRDAIERAMPARGVAIAKAIEGMSELLSERLPRLDDDVNELPDEVC